MWISPEPTGCLLAVPPTRYSCVQQQHRSIQVLSAKIIANGICNIKPFSEQPYMKSGCSLKKVFDDSAVQWSPSYCCINLTARRKQVLSSWITDRKTYLQSDLVDTTILSQIYIFSSVQYLEIPAILSAVFKYRGLHNSQQFKGKIGQAVLKQHWSIPVDWQWISYWSCWKKVQLLIKP